VPDAPTGIVLVRSSDSPNTSLMLTWTNPTANDAGVIYKVRLARLTSSYLKGNEIEASNGHAFTWSSTGNRL